MSEPEITPEIVAKHGIKHIQAHVTKDNYKKLLKPLLTEGEGQGFCVNLSVDTGSLDLMKLCRKLDVLYIDTVVEPWLGFYFDKNMKNSERTNYALRETVRQEKAKNPGGTTAVSTCGANPGMVSWFVKQALVNVANELGIKFDEPDQNDREGWAKLMKKVGVKGVHIAERDTQRTKNPKPLNVFWNTWSVEGFISEGLQPAELGWGTHENWMPKNAKKHKKGCKAAIYLEQPGANTRVRTWCPTPGPQYGFLVTHNESISIADYFTVEKDGEVVYRPTCHYAYHPSNDAVLSLHEMFGKQYDELAPAIDEIAERIRALGFNAPGSYAEFVKLSSIREESAAGTLGWQDMVRQLVAGNEAVCRTARKVLKTADEAGDDPTADLATQRLQVHEKNAWMLRSLLE